jgi:Flp pilus assembly pilin Flp
MLMRLLNDRRGTTSIEYALICVGIGVAIMLAILALGGDVTALIGSASERLRAATGT